MDLLAIVLFLLDLILPFQPENLDKSNRGSIMWQDSDVATQLDGVLFLSNLIIFTFILF